VTRRLAPLAVALAVALAGAGASPGAGRPSSTVRLIFGGDVMLGRGVARLARLEPAAVFGGIRPELAAADLTVANLESPLTTRPHDPAHGPNALEGRPATARILTSAGFDAMAIANNHAGDAGPKTVPDTMRALVAARLGVIGAGHDLAAAYTPLVRTVRGVRVAFLSFDDTGEGPRAARSRPGVAWWDPARARAAVERARSEADVVVVGLHGGSDYNPTTDPWLFHLGRLLAGWGADIVWGTGPHVVQPTELVPGRDGRVTVVATSLGNLVFDQHLPGTRDGELLEVVAGAGGVRAYRLGTTAQAQSNAVGFGSWKPPRGDATALGGEWWTLARRVALAPVERPSSLQGFPGEVVAAVIGDPEGDGGRQLAVSFWRPYRPTKVNALIPRGRLVDRRGLTAHVGIYTVGARRELWVAGTVLSPVVRLAACDGSLAVGYSTLDGSAVVGTSVWLWRGFGFSPLPLLAGRGIPGCADVDGEGRLDPVILGRRR
jgi:poly-gamma-glutamate capsule biosynthesis protein CapA/YwtB (metallophosphatase superfamily)